VDEADLQMELEVRERMMQYVDEFSQLAVASNVQARLTESNLESGIYVRILGEKVRMMNKTLSSIDFRWNTFYQAEQGYIAENDDLMALMTKVQQIRQAVSDSIEMQRKKCDAVSDFCNAKELILSKDSVYKRMYQKARKLSMVKKLGPHLEKLKAQEQTIFGNIEAGYSSIKAAIETVPELSSFSKDVDECYYGIKAISGKIQALEYQPLFLRIKDYLIGLTCMAVIMMFFSLIISKAKAAKKMRDTLKQQKELLNKANGNTYPTI
jgi:hypothetical protein